jgi:ABC-type nickel/cobalt efflux system permease component RcnA
MKNAIAKSLLFLFLFSALVPAQAKEELAKLSALLEHFKEHKLEDPSIGFLAFYKMHYGEGFAKHQSDHDHSGLPMKHQCDHLHAPALALLPQQAFTAPHFFELANGNQPVFIDQSYEFSLPQDIWQPPRA